MDSMVIQYLLVLLVIVWLRGRGVSSASLANRGCQNTCGGVDIPYPFGIGAGCYANDDFEITCNHSFNPPKPYLTSYNLEIIIFYDFSGLLLVRHPLLASVCPNGTSVHRIVNFSTSFWFNEDNYFMATGCNNLALMMNQGHTIVGGCTSICNLDNSTPSPPSQSGYCYGIGCCQTTIPPSLNFINASLSNFESNTDVSIGCKYAFIVEIGWSYSVLTNLSQMQEMESIPALVSWGLQGHCNGTRPTLCGKNAFCTSTTNNFSYQCVCKFAVGNPYLPNGCPGDMRRTRIIIIGISTGFGLVLLLIGMWWCSKLVKRRRKLKLRQKFFKRNGGLLLQQQLSSADQGNVEKNKLFTAKELEKATDHFDNNRILGQGGQGTVYKGMLIDGRIVAVKKSKTLDKGNLEQFINEFVILSQINHRNVVQLHGCCLEAEVPWLVYEYIPNGTLYQYIHDQNEDFPLTWDNRVRIATEVAEALAYLHSAASIPIYHRDIKSTNILLDEKYRAKVSDFGTSKSIAMDQTHMTTLVQGTFGYLDPEFFQSSQFTEKSDVYSFGVVLVELLTGQKPISLTRLEERSLATYFVLTMKENRLFDIVDPRVSREGGKEEIMRVANLAKRCLNLSGRKRPTMKEVATELEGTKMSRTVSFIQENYEEDDYALEELRDSWYVDSTSTGSRLDSGVLSSPDVHPLLFSQC